MALDLDNSICGFAGAWKTSRLCRKRLGFVFQQDFTAEAANQKWVAGIPCVWTEAGRLCLAVVLDLHSRAVVGFGLRRADGARAGGLRPAMAVWRRRPGCGLVAHSDRGSQYASGDCQAALELHGFLCSMSKKGDCHDNAAMESLFHSLKAGQVNGCRHLTREEAKADVFEYVEAYHNPIRRHSTLSHLSPREFENRMAA